MSKLWAIVCGSGTVQLRHDDPADDGQAALQGKSVFTIDREPLFHLGETVCLTTGAIVFDISLIKSGLFEEIKRAAERRILEIAPLWRQLNDLANPDEQGASDRRTQINAIRKWSEDMEARVTRALTATDIATVRIDLQNF